VHDRLLVIGSHDPSFYTKHITLNGAEEFTSPPFDHDATYRLRVINMAPNLSANLQIGTADHLATWRPISKDGADLPSRLSIPGNAQLHIASGETYDFEFRPTTPGRLPIQVEKQPKPIQTDRHLRHPITLECIGSTPLFLTLSGFGALLRGCRTHWFCGCSL